MVLLPPDEMSASLVDEGKRSFRCGPSLELSLGVQNGSETHD